MKATRTDFELPERPVSDSEIANLEAELERRKAARAQQEAEAIERGRQRQEAERQELARQAASEAERQRRLEIVGKAETIPAASGATHHQESWKPVGIKVSFDSAKALVGWGAVVVAKGELSIPVVTVTGEAITVEGPTLGIRRLESQLLTQRVAETYLSAYRLAAEQAFLAGVRAEFERVSDPAACLLYVAGFPLVTVVEDEASPSLRRVVASWGESFAYVLPPIDGPGGVHLCPDGAADHGSGTATKKGAN